MASIDFRAAGAFTSPLFSTQKSARRALRDGVVTASVVLFVAERGLLFVGLTDGKILCWETDRQANEKRKGALPRVLEEHHGSVRCMIYVPQISGGVMLTGAADRCVKLWDLSDPRGGVPCVHSLHGHGGTVLALEHGDGLLLSSGTDGQLFVWRDQSPVRLLRFPAYGVKQRLASRSPKETWFLSLSLREGESPSIFAGDSEGFVHVFRPDAQSAEQLFLLVCRVKVHELGISKLLCVPMESFLFTLSYDQCFKTLDSHSLQLVFEESNPCGVIFNGLAWDSPCQDVIVGDGRGNIGFYNLYTEACTTWHPLTPGQAITQLHYDPATQKLLLLSPHALRVFDVLRGVKFAELNEHTGPVVAMASRPTAQGGLLYTAAMDNTIRLWDTDTLECIKCLREKRDEITAMVYLPRANVLVTGHESSDLKLWSLETAEPSVLRQVHGAPVHANTISCLCSAELPSGGEGELLVAGSYDRRVSLWRVTLTSDGAATAKLDRSFLAHEAVDDEILAVAQGRGLFTGGNHGVVRQRSWTGDLEREYEGHSDAVVCFAVDGTFLFSGSADCTVRVWETSVGLLLRSIPHSAAVQALLVLEDGLLASCAAGRLVLWDPATATDDAVQEIRSFEQPQEFRSLALLEASRTILVGCESGKIIGFPVPGEWAMAPPAILEGVATPTSETEGRGTLELCRTGRLPD